MRSSSILIVQVVGVLPDVEGQQRPEAMGYGVVCAGALKDGEGAVFVGGKPHPAGAEEADTFGFKLRLECLETSPLLIDPGCQRTRRGGLGGIGWCELGEVEVVVQDLAGVVEDGAGGALRTISSKVIDSYSVPRMSLLRLSTYAFKCFPWWKASVCALMTGSSASGA